MSEQWVMCEANHNSAGAPIALLEADTFEEIEAQVAQVSGEHLFRVSPLRKEIHNAGALIRYEYDAKILSESYESAVYIFRLEQLRIWRLK